MPAVREAIELLAANLRTVASELMPPPTRVELPQGQIVSTRHVPVQRAGLYVPGGGAAYPSSAVMAIVPAQVAGVPGSAVCSPPAADGRVHSAVLAVCALLGVTEIYAAAVLRPWQRWRLVQRRSLRWTSWLVPVTPTWRRPNGGFSAKLESSRWPVPAS